MIDVQNGIVRGAIRRDEVVGNIASRGKEARQHAAAVIWIQHSAEHLAVGSEDWQIVAELAPEPREPVIGKTQSDAFERTTLDATLRDRSIRHVIVVGAQTDACVEATVRGAIARSYDVTLVTGAHTTKHKTALGAPPPHEIIASTNERWRQQDIPERMVTAVSTRDVTFGAGGLERK